MLKEMKAYGHLKPGQKGTRRLLARFGAALVCVRYRYDERTGENLTTAEIIVDRRPRLASRYRDADMVAVAGRTVHRHGAAGEAESRRRALESGGTGQAGLFWCDSRRHGTG